MTGLRSLTTPVKIISLAFLVMFGLLTFFSGTFVSGLVSSKIDANAAIEQLEKNKLDKVVFERQCDVTRGELAQKADKDKVEVVQRRLDQIIAIMLDPAKKEAVRAQIQAEKANR
jgi:hypothetical protein